MDFVMLFPTISPFLSLNADGYTHTLTHTQFFIFWSGMFGYPSYGGFLGFDEGTASSSPVILCNPVPFLHLSNAYFAVLRQDPFLITNNYSD